MLLWLSAYICNWLAIWLSGYLGVFLCLVVGSRPRFHSVWSRPLCNCLVNKINQGTDVLTHNCLPPLLALCVLKHVCTRLIILTSNHNIKIDVASRHSPLRLQIPLLSFQKMLIALTACMGRGGVRKRGYCSKMG